MKNWHARHAVVLVALLGIGTAATLHALELLEQTHWTPTSATIVQSGIDAVVDDDDNESYEVHGLVSWMVSNQRYHWSESRHLETFDDEATANRALAGQYHPGSQVDASVDPTDPSALILGRTTTTDVQAMFCFVVFALLMLISLAGANVRWRGLWKQMRRWDQVTEHVPPSLIAYERDNGAMLIVNDESVFLQLIFPVLFPVAFGGGGLGLLLEKTDILNVTLGALFLIIGVIAQHFSSYLFLTFSTLEFQTDVLELKEYRGPYPPKTSRLSRAAVRRVVLREVDDVSAPTNWTLVAEAAEKLEIFQSTAQEQSEWVGQFVSQWAEQPLVSEEG